MSGPCVTLTLWSLKSRVLHIYGELCWAVLDGQVAGQGCRSAAVGAEQLQKLEARRSGPPCWEGERRIERNQPRPGAR